MLVVVLVLVLVAAALLVIALVTSAMLWAWLSVGVSVAAALALLLDWTHRRQARADDAAPPAEPRPAPDVVPPPEEAGDAEPAEEDTDAADLLVVSDLDTEVRVVDERPRYHLADCTWLAGRPTLGLPVSEARQLGFTACAVCRPDSTLAAAKRTAG